MVEMRYYYRELFGPQASTLGIVFYDTMIRVRCRIYGETNDRIAIAPSGSEQVEKKSLARKEQPFQAIGTIVPFLRTFLCGWSTIPARIIAHVEGKSSGKKGRYVRSSLQTPRSTSDWSMVPEKSATSWFLRLPLRQADCQSDVNTETLL